MSFPRYARYRDSGVEWLGEVPEHWTVLSLGRVTTEKCDGPFGSGLKSEHYVDAGVRVIRLQNIRRYGFDCSDEAFIDETYFNDELTRHDVRAGDVLIAGLGDERNTVGRACVAPNGVEPAMVKADCFRFRLESDRALSAFVALQLTAGSDADAGVLSSGSTRSRIPLSIMASRQLALPPTDEQEAIASFIEFESSKVDALVAEQRRLIELLKEKRQAVISHAVTKGLNPNAPMKPSGIEWLGDVPAHWNVAPVKRVARSIEQGWSPQCESFPVSSDEEWGVLKVGCVNGGAFTPSENKSLPADLESMPELGLQEGDLLISRANTRELVGSAAVVERAYPRLMLCDKLYRLRFDASMCCPRYLASYLGTSIARGQIELGATGASASMVNIAQSTIMDLPMPVPPVREQEEIVRVIDNRLSDLHGLTAEAERAIALLQERRAALISAAVTGKIDVRGVAG